MSARIGTFEKDGKSYPTIRLNAGDDGKIFLSFGVTKARLILRHVDEIKKFVQDNGGLD